MNRDCQRWTELSDRQAVGQTFDEDEDEFFRQHVRQCVECSREDDAWRALKAPSLVEGPASENAVDRALSGALSSNARERHVRQRWTAVAIGTLAIAAAFALWFTRSGETPRIGSIAARSGAHPGAALDRPPASPLAPSIAPGTCSELSSGLLACTTRDTLVAHADLQAKERVLELGRGRILVSLAPQSAGTSFSIVTHAGRVTAVGTIFSVELIEGGGLIARVLEGKVAVRASNDAEARFVRAGERWRLGDAQPSALTAEDRERDLALLPPEPRAALESAAASDAARAPTPDALLARALALRAQGEFRQAAETYRKIHEMSPKSAAGGTALVSRGELLLSSLNDPRGALSAFEAYLAQGGALSREAAFGRVRALRTLGRTADERRGILEFLSRYPDAPQSRVLRQRLVALGQ